MVGLGEKNIRNFNVMEDMRRVNVDFLTVDNISNHQGTSKINKILSLKNLNY